MTRLAYLTMLALLACNLSASAQSTNQLPLATNLTHARMGPARVVRRAQGLGENEAKELEPFLREQQDKMFALRTNTALSRRDRAARMKETRESTDAELKQHLTPEQAEKWKTMRGRHQFLQPTTAAATNRFATPEQVALRPKLSAERGHPAGTTAATSTTVLDSLAATNPTCINPSSTNSPSSSPSAASAPQPATWQFQTNRHTGQVRPRPSARQAPRPASRLSTNAVSVKPQAVLKQ